LGCFGFNLVPLTLVQEPLNESTRPLTHMGRPQFGIRLFPKILEKLANFHDLHHLEIGSTQWMKQTHRFGKGLIFVLGINELIGIYDLLIVFPFSCANYTLLSLSRIPFILIDSLSIVMKKKFI
jgi:hypothetical protein